MASSSSSLENNNNSLNSFNNFTFSTHPFMTTSFSDLLASPIDDNKLRGESGFGDRGVPKFKSTPPPSLPLTPPSVSPSNYFSIPPGLSPAQLLDSPVLLNSSNVSFIHSLHFFLLVFFNIINFYFLFWYLFLLKFCFV